MSTPDSSRPRVLRHSAAVFVGVAVTLRVALLLRNAADADLSVGRVAAILGIGFLFDVVAWCYLAIPLVLYLALAPDRLLASRPHRWVAAVLWGAYVYVCLFGATVEWYFWDEFGARFNFVAVDYLVYTKEVVGNIRESYPLQWILPALAVPAALIIWRTHRPVAEALATPTPLRRRWTTAAALFAVPAVAGFAVWDEYADFTQNRVDNQLARNGVHSLFAAFWNNRLEYEHYYVTRPEAEVVQHLRELTGAPRDPAATDLTRRVEVPGPESRRNVVVVCVESLSAWFLPEFRWEDDKQPDPALMPRLTELSQKSLFFTRMYSTGTRTVRGLEAVTLSFPPTPGASVVKRPGFENLFSAGFLFRDRGYATRFVYGGWGRFDNMGPFFHENGFEVTDRSDLGDDENHFANVWGVCDEDMFDRTLKECDRAHAAGKPFFQFVMTTSNHLPFTYPDGRIDIPSGTGREGAVKYTDHAIGRFLDDAAKHEWFKDTVFVVVADHCSSSRGKTELPVHRFHVPCWIYAPGFVEPRRVDDLCSQIDVMPTLLGLLGWSYESRFLGADVLRRPPGRALLCNYLHLGLYDGTRLLTLGPNREVTMDAVSDGGRKVKRAKTPDPALVADAVAWFQGASLMVDTGRQGRVRREGAGGR